MGQVWYLIVSIPDFAPLLSLTKYSPALLAELDKISSDVNMSLKHSPKYLWGFQSAIDKK